MKKRFFKTAIPILIVAVMVVASVLAFTPQTAAAEEQGGQADWTTQIDSMLCDREYVEGEVIALFDNSKLKGNSQIMSVLTAEAEVESLAEVSSESAVETFNVDVDDSTVDIQLISSESKTTREILDDLADNPAVVWAEPNYISYIDDYEEEIESSDATADDTEDKSDEKANDSDEQSDDVSDVSEDEKNETPDETKDNDIISSEIEKDSDESQNVEPENAEVESTGVTRVKPTAEVKDLITEQGYSSIPNLGYLQWGYTEADTGLYSISSPNWNTTSGKNVTGTPVVAVVDSGIDYTHPEFENLIVDMRQYSSKGGQYGYNCSTNGAGEDEPMDDNGHGTHCAGIIAAKWDGIGSSGVASGVKLCIVKVGDANGNMSNSSIIKAFIYLVDAVDEGLNLYSVNCSFGGDGSSNVEALMAKELGKRGVIICKASGNSSFDNDDHPSTSSDISMDSNCIVVNASAANYVLSDYTQYGQTTTHLFSPGDAILAPVSSFSQKYFASVDQDRKFYDGFDTSTASENQVKITYVGKYNIKQTALIEFKTHNELKTFIDGATSVGQRITTTNSFDNDGYAYEVEVGGMTSKDERQVFLVSIPFGENVINQISHISCALKSTLNNAQTWVKVISFDNSETNEITIDLASNMDWQRPSNAWTNMSCPVSEKAGFTANSLPYYKGYIYCLISVKDSNATGETSKLYIDSIGAGNRVMRYDFYQGTSMATPAITGAVAVMYDKLETNGTLEGMTPEEKAAYVANTMKASVIQAADYSSKCTSNGAFSFAVAASDYVPVINSVSQDDAVVTIKGQYFGTAKGNITIADTNCTINSWTDTEIKLLLPSSVPTGRSVLSLTATNGKTTSRKVITTGTTGKVGFDVQVDLPEEINTCRFIAMTGLNGELYVVPETTSSNYTKPIEAKQLWSYNPKTNEWKQHADMPDNVGYDNNPKSDEVVLSTYKGLIVVSAKYYVKESPQSNEKAQETVIFFYNPKTETWTSVDYGDMGLPSGGTVFASDYGVFYQGGRYQAAAPSNVSGVGTVESTTQWAPTNKIFKLNFNVDEAKASKDSIKINSVVEAGETKNNYDTASLDIGVYRKKVLIKNVGAMEEIEWSDKEQKYIYKEDINIPADMQVIGEPGQRVGYLSEFACALTADGLLISAFNGDNYVKRGYDTFYLGANDKVTPYDKYAYFADLRWPIACVTDEYYYVWGNTYYNDDVLGYLAYTKIRNPGPEPETTTAEPTTTIPETTTSKGKVDTGDRSNSLLYIVIIICAAATITTAVVVRRCRNR